MMKPTSYDELHEFAKKLKLDDGVGFLVRVLSGRATSIYEELTGQVDITPQQFGVLLTLHQQGTMTLGEITKATRADQSTTGEMVRRMVARGLVTRVPGKDDRRTASVSITKSGVAALLALIPRIPALQERLLAPIPPEQRRLFLQNLKRVVEG
jgi:DNA-binding MarR family transcriptional regulator